MYTLFQNKRIMCIVLTVLLVCIWGLTQVSYATDTLMNSAYDEVLSIESMHDEKTEMIATMQTILSMHTDTDEHLMQIEEQIWNYKKGILNYDG